MRRNEPLALDLVSPLPPVRSGIADYSLDLLPELAALCDVRVLRLPQQPVSEAVATRWQPVRAERLAEEDRLPLYQMGNNSYHEAVLEMALGVPGVLCLHDLFIHHLLVERSLARGDLALYTESLAYDHGWVGSAVAQPPRWGGYGQASLFSLPAHRRLVQGQRGVLVHNEWSAEVLREEVGETPVRVVPMPMPLGSVVEPEVVLDFRRRHRIPDGVMVVGCFGFQSPIKRTQTVVRVLSEPGLERVHLLIGGEASPAVDVEAAARQSNVAERVHTTGYLPPDEFPVAIAASDLCINLRYPTAGETSASLLRILAHGRGAVVSDYAQFTEAPGTAALRVPLGEGEVEALAGGVREVLQEPRRLREMGDAARQWIRHRHAPAAAARAIVDACREWRHRQVPEGCGASPPGPSSLSWGNLPGLISITGAEPPWPEGERRCLHVQLRNTGFARWLAGRREEGGVVLEVQMWAGGEDLLGRRPWLALPRDLAPGEELELEISLRRPPGPTRLRVEPHVLGGFGFGVTGGPVWEAAL